MKKFLLLALFIAFSQGKVVIDSDGKGVEVPENVQHATALIGGFVQMAAMLGNESKVITGSPKLPPLMQKIFPKIRSNGNPSGMMGSSVEAILASKTQVVFGPVGMRLDESAAAQLVRAGIVVVNLQVPGTTEQLKRCVSVIADIFGGESPQKAREFNAYFDENVNFVRSRTAKIEQKKRVLVLNFGANAYSTIDSRDMGAEYIAIAGGLNLSSQLGSSGDFKVSKLINEEQIIGFDPDAVLTNSREGVEKILQNPAFKGLKAVKTRQIFVVPSGVYLWSVRSAEGALYPLWLGKTLYPELFADLNMPQKVREFYAKFYGYKLSDAQIQGILQPERWIYRQK